MTPLKAIRARCLDCVGFQKSEVRRCKDTTCPLHPYRMGKNPARAGVGTTANFGLAILRQKSPLNARYSASGGENDCGDVKNQMTNKNKEVNRQ